MITFNDIKVWREEFEQYALKNKKVLNLDKDDKSNYKCVETQELWNAWFNACVAQVERFIRSMV